MILIVQIYVDDIIFGFSNEKCCKDFESCMKTEFEMSMIGELNYFLGLQIKQRGDGFSSIKPSIQENLSWNLGLKVRRLTRLPWVPQLSLTRMNKVKTLTLNSIVIWLIVYFTWRIGQILCLVCVYVLDFILILKRLTWLS